jgi:hypothetical protein
MIPISDELNESLSSDNQVVRPSVKAWMSDLRSLNNLKVHSSSHTYEKQILDRNPQMYLKFDQTDFGASTRISDCLLQWTSYTGPLQVLIPAHGLNNGDEIVFSTDASVGLPLDTVGGIEYGVKSGEIHYTNRFYVQQKTANTFYLNTTRANAVSGSATGRVVNYYAGPTIGLAGITVTVGARATFTANHGLSDGDAIVLTTFGGTMPGGITELDASSDLPIYYVQNSTATTFNLNTNYSNAVNNLPEGMVETTSALVGTLYSYTVHKATNNVAGGHRVKDYGEQAFDVALGTSDAGLPIYDQTANTYHDSFQNHIQILEPNRLIDTFNKGQSGFLLNAYVSKASAAIVSYGSHGLASGTPVMFEEIGGMSGINTTTVYYVDRIGAGTFYLNTSYYNAINKISSGRVNTSASASGNYTTINIYNGNSVDFFTKSGSVDATSSDMSYYSWDANDPKWKCVGGKLKFLDGVIDDDLYYVSTPVNSLDHFVDFRVDSGKGRNIYTRFIDEDNCVALSFSSFSYTYPITITAFIDGNAIPLANIDPGTLASFSTTHYYRFHAKYNLFLLYDMGTSEPTNASSGTLIGQGYFDHPKLRTDEAKRCALGFGNQVTLNPTANLYALECQYYYFAAYGFDSLSGAFYFNYDNSTASEKKYLYSSTALSSAKTTQFQSLNNASNFTYSFYLYKQSSTNRKYTIFWLGNSDRETALRISYVEAANDYLNVLINSSSTSYELNSTTLTNNTLYHVSVIKNSTKLSIYIDGVEVASRNDIPANFVLKDVVTGKTPYIMFGGDYAGTTLGDPAGYHLAAYAYISEFAMFDYALTETDLDALYYSVDNGATLAQQTVDDYCNAECIIDGKPEETFTYAFTNMLNNKGSVIKANNSIYSVSPLANTTNKANIEENYGWMSRLQSDGDGLFVTTDFVELTFDAAKCNKIFVSTGYLSGRVDTFNYIITKSDLTTISGGKAFSGDSYTYITASDLGLLDDEYLDIISIRVIPTATVNNYDYARLFSINPIWEVDLSDYVISFSVEKVRDNYDASLPIGATAANNGSLVLDNTDKVFNMFGNTLFGQYTTPDVPFFISLDHELTKYGTSEEIVLASEMYSDTWTFSNSSMTTEVSLRDYSKYLQEKTVDGYVSQGITAGRAISDLMLAAGFPRRKIIYLDKYDEVIFLDQPKIYIPFNDTYEELLSTVDPLDASGTAYLFDHCQYLDMNMVLPNTLLGKSLLYSDSLSIQDESERKLISNIESTFEPYYRQGSMSGYFSDYDSGNIIGNSTNSWTTELFHYVDLDNFAQFDTEIMFMKNANSSFSSYNYLLYYEVSGSEITYSWAFMNTSGVEQKITASPVDASIPHQIVVRKTGGSPNVFDLIIDGVVSATLSTSMAINTANCVYFYIFSSSGYTTETFVSNFSFYDYALSDQSIYNHFVSSSVALISTYRYLYTADETYWDAMLNIATADLGMFYIDEYGFFRYEFRNFIHEEIFERYQNSQYSFSDDTNIIEGNFVNEVQTNKISVAVKKISIESTSTSGLWSASDGESLITGTLAASMTPQSSGITLASTTDPYWLSSGYIKIDDEIIRYAGISGNTLTGLERGYFGTAISWHPVGSLVREAKYFNIVYSSKPAAAVKYPLVTNPFIDIDRFSASANSAEVIVSVNENAPKDTVYLLSGTNALTTIKDGFVLAGIAVSNSSSEELITEMSSEVTSNIRRYGVKELKIDNPFIQNKDYAKLVADYVLGYYKEPVRILDMEVLAVPNLQLGDLITVSKLEDLGIVDKKYWVVSSSISYDGGIRHSLSLRAYGDTIERPGFTFGSTGVAYTPPSGGGGGREFFPMS